MVSASMGGYAAQATGACCVQRTHFQMPVCTAWPMIVGLEKEDFLYKLPSASLDTHAWLNCGQGTSPGNRPCGSKSRDRQSH